MKSEVTTAFNNQFQGNLELGRIGGFLPFSASVNDGRVYAPSDSSNPVFSFEKAEVSLNLWELMQQNLSIRTFEVSDPTIFLTRRNDRITFFHALSQRRAQTEETNILEGGEIRLLQRINIFAPSVSVSNGRIEIDESINLPEQMHVQAPLTVENVSLDLFLEVTDFLDVGMAF